VVVFYVFFPVNWKVWAAWYFGALNSSRRSNKHSWSCRVFLFVCLFVFLGGGGGFLFRLSRSLERSFSSAKHRPRFSLTLIILKSRKLITFNLQGTKVSTQTCSEKQTAKATHLQTAVICFILWLIVSFFVCVDCELWNSWSLWASFWLRTGKKQHGIIFKLTEWSSFKLFLQG